MSISHDHAGTGTAHVSAPPTTTSTSGGSTINTNAIHKAYKKKYEIPLLRNIQTAEVIHTYIHPYIDIRIHVCIHPYIHRYTYTYVCMYT